MLPLRWGEGDMHQCPTLTMPLRWTVRLEGQKQGCWCIFCGHVTVTTLWQVEQSWQACSRFCKYPAKYMKLLLSSNVMRCATLQSDLSAATHALLLMTLGRVGSDVLRQRGAAASKIGTSWATSTQQLPEHAGSSKWLTLAWRHAETRMASDHLEIHRVTWWCWRNVPVCLGLAGWLKEIRLPRADIWQQPTISLSLEWLATNHWINKIGGDRNRWGKQT